MLSDKVALSSVSQQHHTPHGMQCFRENLEIVDGVSTFLYMFTDFPFGL